MDRLLDEYLRTVASYLRNGPQRDDIITELSGHLQSKIEERRAGLDRPMTRVDEEARRQNRRMPAEASHRRWRPSHLRAIPRWYSVSGIVAMTLLGLWWMALPAMPALLLGANASQLGLSDRWDDFRVPILMLLLAGIVLRVVTLWRPNAGWLRYGGRLLINVLCLATLPYILKGYPLVVVADPRTAGVDARALALATSDWIWWILAAGFGSYWLINVVINSSFSVRYVRDVRHQGPNTPIHRPRFAPDGDGHSTQLILVRPKRPHGLSGVP